MINRAWIPERPRSAIHLLAKTTRIATMCGLTIYSVPEGEAGFVSQPMPGQPENRCKKCMEALKHGNNG